jgi:hypothetical protein
VNAQTNFEARYNRVQEHLDTVSIDVQQSGAGRPVPYVFDEVQLQGTTRFNRLGITGIATTGPTPSTTWMWAARRRRARRMPASSPGSTSTAGSAPSASPTRSGRAASST